MFIFYEKIISFLILSVFVMDIYFAIYNVIWKREKTFEKKEKKRK